MNDILAILIILAVIAAVIFAFFRVRKMAKRGSSSMATVVYGSTTYLLTQDQREAGIQIVEENAGKIEEKDDIGEKFEPEKEN